MYTVMVMKHYKKLMKSLTYCIQRFGMFDIRALIIQNTTPARFVAAYRNHEYLHLNALKKIKKARIFKKIFFDILIHFRLNANASK